MCLPGQAHQQRLRSIDRDGLRPGLPVQLHVRHCFIALAACPQPQVQPVICASPCGRLHTLLRPWFKGMAPAFSNTNDTHNTDDTDGSICARANVPASAAQGLTSEHGQAEAWHDPRRPPTLTPPPRRRVGRALWPRSSMTISAACARRLPCSRENAPSMVRPVCQPPRRPTTCARAAGGAWAVGRACRVGDNRLQAVSVRSVPTPSFPSRPGRFPPTSRVE
jgi:hypothetical protein